jgi:UDP-glucose 4-epimerase
MNFAITGTSGYIGSVLCQRLLDLGHTVVSVDHRPLPQQLQADHPNLRHFYGDFSQTNFCVAVVEYGCDHIFHLAAHSLLGPSVTNPMPYFANNAGNLAAMLDTLNHLGWKGNIVFSSTAATYGAQNHLVSEFAPTRPINPYGKSKLQAEQILQSAYEAHGIKSVIFRYFNVAGAYRSNSGKYVGQPKDQPHILTQMSRAATAGFRFKIYGDDYSTKDGTCVRDYVHVMDVVEAHLLAVDKLFKDSVYKCPEDMVFNLGSSRGTSNKELVETFRYISGVDLKVEITPRRPGDPDFLVADSTKFTRWTGYEFPYSNIKQIVLSQWDYFNA